MRPRRRPAAAAAAKSKAALMGMLKTGGVVLLVIVVIVLSLMFGRKRKQDDGGDDLDAFLQTLNDGNLPPAPKDIVPPKPGTGDSPGPATRSGRDGRQPAARGGALAAHLAEHEGELIMAEAVATVTNIGTPLAAANAAGPPDGLELTRGMTGRRKAAILILQLDRAASARVLAELSDAEIEDLAAEIARAGDVPADVSAAVLKEFGILQASGDTVFAVASSRAGPCCWARWARAGPVPSWSGCRRTMFDLPFKFLQHADARQLLNFISDEHPQTIALVLAHVPAPLASKVLAGLGPDLQADVAHRIATMESTSPDIIHAIEANLERRMASLMVPSDLSAVGGVQPLVEIINRADRGTEKLILEGLEERDPELAEEVRSRMFLFEDLINLEDRAVQLVLRQVEVANLAIALKGVAPVVHQKIMNNMSERAAITLAEEIELLGPVRVQSVEEAQTEVVRVIRELEESGQIVVSRGDADEFVA